MTDTHIFPVLEPDLHITSPDCECKPVKDEDDKTGHVTWIHIPLLNDHIIGRLNIEL